MSQDDEAGTLFKSKVTEWIFAISFGLWAGVIGICTNLILEKMDKVSLEFTLHKDTFATYQIMNKQDIIEIRERQTAITARLNELEADLREMSRRNAKL